MTRCGSGRLGLVGFLQLTDSAFPAGGFGHSGGIEALGARGLVRDAASLEAILAGHRRLTLARGDAWFVGRAYRAAEGFDAPGLCAVASTELAARPAEVQRSAALALGRNLLRTASATLEEDGGGQKLAFAASALGDRAPRATAFGAVAAVLGTGEEEAIEGYVY